MPNKLQCAVCLSPLSLNEISALHCGHTFHMHCILQWFQSSATCPVCRKRATSREHVKQLFFQFEEDNLGLCDDDPNDDPIVLKAKLQDTLDELQKQKKLSEVTLSRLTARELEFYKLEKKVATLEKTICCQLAQLQFLEDMRRRQQHAEKELEQCRKRLQATEFYSFLSNMKENPVSEIDKYIGKNGLEVEKFVTLLRRQLKNANNAMEKQKADLCKCRKKVGELQKKLNEHKELNVALKKELASARNDLSETIMNPALQEVIAFSPEPRSSAQSVWNDRKMFPASLIASAYGIGSRKGTGTQNAGETTPTGYKSKVFQNEAESALRKVVEDEPQPDDEEFEEVFVPPAVRKCASRGVLRETISWKRKQKPEKTETALAPKKKMAVRSDARKNIKILMVSKSDLNSTINLE